MAGLAAPGESVEMFRLDSFSDSFNKDCGVFPTFLWKVNAKLFFEIQDLVPAVNLNFQKLCQTGSFTYK